MKDEPRDVRFINYAGPGTYYQTVPVGSSFETVALTLDPRGYPISGATLAYAAQSVPDNQGTVGFVGGAHALTNPDGSSFKDVVFSSAGKAEFGPSFIATFSGSPLAAPEGGPQAVRVKRPIPRYQPVAHLAASVGSLRPDGTITLRIGSFQRLPIERRHVRKDVPQGASNEPKPDLGSRGGSLSPRERAGVRAQTVSSAPRANLLADPGFEPIDASIAIPLAEPPREMIARAQGITSCAAAAFSTAGTTAAQVNPPYTVTLTDLTPSSGQTQPNGEVGVEGIHGHRVEKVIRLRIQIKDKYGVEPTYPVLVHLATGGPHHGTLVLDPDGTRKECSNASFLWHERDTQGNLIALNEEFEYRMGTWSRYVGVEPNPNNPSQLKPVWGVAEDLEIGLETPDGAPLSYRVHPEPGRPDHFACWEGPNLPCGDLFAFWTGSFFSGETITDAYHLEDGWGNATYGYTDTAATQPGAGVAVQFTDQTAGTAGNFAGYTLASQWPTNPAPSGQMASTLSVDYPDDPDGDWAAGTVTKAITYDFSGGSSHVLIQKQNYDARFGVDESAWPLSVAPGAGEGAMPKTASGDTPRLVLLALSGTTIPSRIPAGPYYSIMGQDEPSLDPIHVYRNTGGSWSWVQATDQDAVLEVGGGGEFRLSLVDSSGTVVPGTAFRVDRCPRGEHLTAETPPGACTLGPVDSEALTGVLSSLTLNEAGSQRGYLGIELTKAPVNPGQYFILVESIGSTPYRIRWQSQLIGRSTPDEDLKGGFVICTVLGGQFLDENFAPFPNGVLTVSQPTTVNLRVEIGGTGEVSTASLTSEKKDGSVFEGDVTLPMSRIGSTGMYFGALTAVPDGYPGDIPTGRPVIHIPVGGGILTATQASGGGAGASQGLSAKAQSVQTTLWARILDFFGPRLVVRFLKRGCTSVDDSCLTPAPDSSHPELAGTRQQTEIIRNVGPFSSVDSYAERVNLRVDAVNPFLPNVPIPSFSGKLLFEEIPNPEYMDQPGAGKSQRFYDGVNFSSRITVDGRLLDAGLNEVVVNLAGGQAAFSLDSVATARYRSVSGVLIPSTASTPYRATIQVRMAQSEGPWDASQPLESDAFWLSQWVDERTYARDPTGVAWGANDASNSATDWLEVRVMDFCVDPANASVAEAGTVLARVVGIQDIWDPAGNMAQVTYNSQDPILSATIQMRPDYRPYRIQPVDGPVAVYAVGLENRYDYRFEFPRVVSHEARHCWQNEFSTVDGLTDADHDRLPATAPASSPEVTDAHYGSVPLNPEFDFHGDGFDEYLQPEYGAEAFCAFERNAYRFEALFNGSTLQSADFLWAPIPPPPGGGPAPLGGLLFFKADPGSPDRTAGGTLIKVEAQGPGAECSATTGWNFRTYSPTDPAGNLPLVGANAGVYRLTVVPPREWVGAPKPSWSICITVP
jgi:hypothetical protein